MSKRLSGSFGATILVLACVGCASGSITGGTTTGTATGGSPSVCEPPCGENASCKARPQGGVACDCDESYRPCPDADGGSVCVDELLDRNHCGGCGVACSADQSCLDGGCVCALTLCPGLDGGLQCVDLTHDDNCGGCGVTCFENQECASAGGGAAACVCVDGGPGVRLESCSGVCTDTNSDPFDCGGCDVVCASGSCILGDAGTGVCNCPSPYTLCGLDCVDTSSDPTHCGSCELSCVIQGGIPELVCTDGHCLCGPTGRGTLCLDGTCALLSTDPQNCGQCGNVCVDPAPDCVDGGCSPG